MSNSKKKYNLVFERKLKIGEDLDVVKERLKKFFKGNPQAVEKLFLKKSCVIKKNVTLSEAEKYQTVIESVGVECVIVAINNDHGIRQMTNGVDKPGSQKNTEEQTSSTEQNKGVFLGGILLLIVMTLGGIYLFYPAILGNTSNENEATSLNRLSEEQEVNEDLVVNGTFDSDEFWENNAGWFIDRGRAISDGTTGSLINVGGQKLIKGDIYIAELTVISRSEGSITLPYDGAGNNLFYVNAVGKYEHKFMAVSNNYPRIHSRGFKGSIDNIEVKKEIYDNLNSTKTK